MTPIENNPNNVWEKQTIEKLLFENLKEQRRRRRWSLFFRSIYLILVLSVVVMLLPEKNMSTASRLKPHIAYIEINGEISDSSTANSEDITDSLGQAFNDPNTVSVILQINSPGGSAVQATDVYSEIIHLRKKHPKINIYAVCGDLCTSAAYYIASATNEIYASPASLVGSIGVMIDGFGFVDTMKKFGVERRLLTAGSEKGFLDPFSPLKPEEQQFALNLLKDVHTQFINDVKAGRGDRLKDDPKLFSGLAWTGQQALQLGLIDAIGNMRYVARNVIKNTNVVDYTVRPTFFEQVSRGIGSMFPHELSAYLKRQQISF